MSFKTFFKNLFEKKDIPHDVHARTESSGTTHSDAPSTSSTKKSENRYIPDEVVESAKLHRQGDTPAACKNLTRYLVPFIRYNKPPHPSALLEASAYLFVDIPATESADNVLFFSQLSETPRLTDALCEYVARKAPNQNPNSTPPNALSYFRVIQSKSVDLLDEHYSAVGNRNPDFVPPENLSVSDQIARGIIIETAKRNHHDLSNVSPEHVVNTVSSLIHEMDESLYFANEMDPRAIELAKAAKEEEMLANQDQEIDSLPNLAAPAPAVPRTPVGRGR